MILLSLGWGLSGFSLSWTDLAYGQKSDTSTDKSFMILMKLSQMVDSLKGRTNFNSWLRTDWEEDNGSSEEKPHVFFNYFLVRCCWERTYFFCWQWKHPWPVCVQFLSFLQLKKLHAGKLIVFCQNNGIKDRGRFSGSGIWQRVLCNQSFGSLNLKQKGKKCWLNFQVFHLCIFTLLSPIPFSLVLFWHLECRKHF